MDYTFDVDFSDRDAVVRYLKSRWGEDNTSAIIAFGTLSAKAVFRKILSIHGFDMATINVISKSFPRKLELTISDCEASEQFQTFKKKHSNLVEAIYRLEGTIDHISQHAAGILITPKAVREFAPTYYDDTNNTLVAGFDKYMLEELGLYKFDILKLKTLNVIDDTINTVLKTKGIKIDFNETERDDEGVYRDLCDGNVFGVFQLEDQPDLTKKLHPKNFEAITALNALIRPGVGDIDTYTARMNGEPFEYYHEDEKEYMAPTYNTITYQEQFMLRVNKLAGWTLGKGDSLRKVKHIRDNTELHSEFIDGCLNTRKLTSHTLINQAWNEIVDALEGGYSFNKSHAASYADISYQTAWLKHHYPVEFMASLMTWEREDQAQIAERISQCKLLGIKILPPDINKSDESYKVDGEAIRYSINTIKRVGVTALNEINAIRSDYAINSLADLYNRANLRVLDKSVFCNLIKAGCFDFENTNRYELMHQYFMLRKEKKYANEFDGIECTDKAIASMEKEVLGLYLTKSPLGKYSFKPISAFPNQSYATIGGEITKIKTIFDKSNRKMAFVALTTQYGNVELTVFANQYKKLSDFLVEGNIVLAQGKNDNGKLLLNKINLLE